MMHLRLVGSFSGRHLWANAPPQYEKLGELHQHIFHFSALIPVTGDREIEFLELAEKCKVHLWSFLYENPGSSCETLAQELDRFLEELGHLSVSSGVFEDGACGAVYTPERTVAC